MHPSDEAILAVVSRNGTAVNCACPGRPGDRGSPPTSSTVLTRLLALGAHAPCETTRGYWRGSGVRLEAPRRRPERKPCGSGEKLETQKDARIHEALRRGGRLTPVEPVIRETHTRLRRHTRLQHHRCNSSRFQPHRPRGVRAGQRGVHVIQCVAVSRQVSAGSNQVSATAPLVRPQLAVRRRPCRGPAGPLVRR